MIPNDPVDLFSALDSPLCPALAPELMRFRERVLAIMERKGDCSVCQKVKQAQELAIVQVELVDLLQKTPALEALMPQLIMTGKQAAHGAIQH